MITPGYFLFISIPTRDIDHRSGRWSFVFFRWTAHMTTAFTPASWHRLIFCSRAPMSFFVTTIWTVTMEPHFVYSSSSSYMSRLSRTALTSSVGMSIHLFFTCQQLQKEQVKLHRRVSLKEQ